MKSIRCLLFLAIVSQLLTTTAQAASPKKKAAKPSKPAKSSSSTAGSITTNGKTGPNIGLQSSLTPDIIDFPTITYMGADLTLAGGITSGDVSQATLGTTSGGMISGAFMEMAPTTHFNLESPALSLGYIPPASTPTTHFNLESPALYFAPPAPSNSVFVSNLNGNVNSDGKFSNADLQYLLTYLHNGTGAIPSQPPVTAPTSGGEINHAYLYSQATINVTDTNPAPASTTSGVVNTMAFTTSADLQGFLTLLKPGQGSSEAVPEPSTLVLMGLAVGSLAVARRRLARLGG